MIKYYIIINIMITILSLAMYTSNLILWMANSCSINIHLE